MWQCVECWSNQSDITHVYRPKAIKYASLRPKPMVTLIAFTNWTAQGYLATCAKLGFNSVNKIKWIKRTSQNGAEFAIANVCTLLPMHANCCLAWQYPKPPDVTLTSQLSTEYNFPSYSLGNLTWITSTDLSPQWPIPPIKQSSLAPEKHSQLDYSTELPPCLSSLILLKNSACIQH